ncbi:MAG: hypothetical protein MI919_28045 [Holophagales bacterium]|nr:hypothetical protein [Holophagales bacterium]
MKYVVWVIMCFVVSLLGRKRQLGIWGTFLAALFLGPTLALIVMLMTQQLHWGVMLISPVILLLTLLATQPKAAGGVSGS